MYSLTTRFNTIFMTGFRILAVIAVINFALATYYQKLPENV